MTSSDNASVLRFAIFGNAVRHGVSTRRGGVSAPPFASLNLGRRVGDAPEAVTQNRGIFLQQLGLQPEQVFSPSQVHGDSVVVVGEQDAGRGVYGDLRPPIEADAALTQAQGLALLLISADCALLLLQDPAQGSRGCSSRGLARQRRRRGGQDGRGDGARLRHKAGRRARWHSASHWSLLL